MEGERGRREGREDRKGKMRKGGGGGIESRKRGGSNLMMTLQLHVQQPAHLYGSIIHVDY